MKKFSLLMAAVCVLFAAAANAQATRKNNPKDPQPVIAPKKETASPHTPMPATQVQRADHQVQPAPARQPVRTATPKAKLVKKHLKYKPVEKATPARAEK